MDAMHLWLGDPFAVAALFAAAMFFFVLELMHPGISLAGILGFVCLVLVALGYRSLPLPPWMTFALVGLVLGLFLWAVARSVSALRKRKPGGLERLVGQEGVARTRLDPAGTVHILGEEWSAQAEKGPVPARSKVKVTGVEGLVLKVKKA